MSFTEVTADQGFACHWEHSCGKRGDDSSRQREKYCSGLNKIEHEGSSNCSKKKLLQQANLNIHY